MPIKPKKNAPVNHHTLPPFSGKKEHKISKYKLLEPLEAVVPMTVTVSSNINDVMLWTGTGKTVIQNDVTVVGNVPNYPYSYTWTSGWTLLSLESLYKQKMYERDYLPTRDLNDNLRRQRAEEFISTIGHIDIDLYNRMVNRQIDYCDLIKIIAAFGQAEVELTCIGEDRKATENFIGNKVAKATSNLLDALAALPSTDKDGRLFRED